MFFKLRKKKPISLDSNSDESDTAAPDENPPRLDSITPSLIFKALGDLSHFQDRNATLKIWLPQSIADILNELAKKEHSSLSKTLRQFLFTHCYGVYAFTHAIQVHRDIFDDWISGAVFSRGEPSPLPPGKKRIFLYSVPELGKNIVAVKLHLPEKLVEDLRILSGYAGLSTSQYVREIIISRLLGHGTLPRREDLFDAYPTSMADAWSEGEKVTWINTDRRNIRDYQVHDIQPTIVDSE